jgi:hypothetical protein
MTRTYLLFAAGVVLGMLFTFLILPRFFQLFTRGK